MGEISKAWVFGSCWESPRGGDSVLSRRGLGARGWLSKVRGELGTGACAVGGGGWHPLKGLETSAVRGGEQ